MQFEVAQLTARAPRARRALATLILQINDDPGWLDLRHVAYFLATVQWETAGTFRPIEEYGRGKGRRYGALIFGRGYWGRGFVQLTWKKNYERVGQLLGLGDRLVDAPELACNFDIAYDIAAEGMRGGWFTGRKLGDYINGQRCDYVRARRIVNGDDRAQQIAALASQWEQLLKAARRARPAPAETAEPARLPADPPAVALPPGREPPMLDLPPARDRRQGERSIIAALAGVVGYVVSVFHENWRIIVGALCAAAAVGAAAYLVNLGIKNNGQWRHSK